MSRAREMQGVPAQIVYLKADGKRRHPSYCVFAEGKGKNRICMSSQCPYFRIGCHSAAKCDYYKEKQK